MQFITLSILNCMIHKNKMAHTLDNDLIFPTAANRFSFKYPFKFPFVINGMIMYGAALSSTPTDTPTSPRTFLCWKSFMMALSEMNEFSSSMLLQSEKIILNSLELFHTLQKLLIHSKTCNPIVLKFVKYSKMAYIYIKANLHITIGVNLVNIHRVTVGHSCKD